ncbi:MAG: protein-export chaperone SecB [Minwuia sp.]|uniref:protein-export chaperone SecB n=1 Tax=Minwuia sp. TaxID=2493630 RepID=UPI003A89CC86
MADEQPQARPQIMLNIQYIKDLSFEVPNAPQVYVQQDQKPQIGVSTDIDARRLDGNVFEVVLKLEINAKAEDSQVFLVELAYGCVCTMENIPDQQAEPALLIEIPRMIFPFARRIIADITRDGGFPPLLLDPIDFASLYQQNRQRAQQDQPQQG